MPLILPSKSRKMHLQESTFSSQRHTRVGLWHKYLPIIAKFSPVKNFSYIPGFMPELSGVLLLTVIIQRTLNEYEPAIYMCKETAQKGVPLKEYHCVHTSQVNYGKPSDCNKIIRCKFNEFFHSKVIQVKTQA